MYTHTPVLLDEVLETLAPQPGDVIVDATVGLGGHAAALAEAASRGEGASPRVIAFDLDEGNLERARDHLESVGVEVTAVHDNFVRVPHHLRKLGVRADVVLADLGFSSSQMDDPERGFGFSHAGPLDMRLDRRQPVTARDLLATLDERELADVIHRYGEDPFARAIARRIIQARRTESIDTTDQLARLVVEAYGPRARSSRLHPATRTFMALRIAVNDELTALQSFLEQIESDAQRGEGGTWLRPGARISIISFHSLEDRMIKRAFADLVQCQLATRVTKKPIRASEAECQANPRARSAKLRAIRLGSDRTTDPGQQTRPHETA